MHLDMTMCTTLEVRFESSHGQYAGLSKFTLSPFAFCQAGWGNHFRIGRYHSATIVAWALSDSVFQSRQ